MQAEKEALQIMEHKWALEGVEDELTGMAAIHPETILIKNKMYS